jgi:GNAT superfamily N-acetyltransferase
MTNNSENVRVREATAEDAPAIAQAHVDSWQGAYPGLIPDRFLDRISLAGREHQWRHTLSGGTEGPLVLVVDSGDELAGFSTVAIPSRDHDEPDDVAEIPAIYVRPSAWGTGVGSALMDASVAAMRGAGCREAILWAVAGNERAAAFYSRQGWHDDGGRRPSQYFPDATEVVEVRFRRRL